ncbi:hypothetical protein LQU92_05710 [Kocuria sp. LUK]|uniref:hypothetical protein n=1 Tax=Kocuria sp. LUK TaxID=2897828 RepID=UPI001E471B2A|nr:hypothetical protein [Kocuria sp. LUK]MCD1144740.1 hypothetical protein [Kocuria sp. LUK]
MTPDVPRPPRACPHSTRLAGTLLLVLALTGCAGGAGEETTAATTGPTGASDPAGSPSPAATTPGAAPGETAPPAANGTPTGAPSGNDVAPYDGTATRDAGARFGTSAAVAEGLEARVDGPRHATTGQRSVRAAPGTPVQVFTLTLTNTGDEPVDAVPWSFPVALAGDEPATPAFDEDLGARMETFPTLEPGGSTSLDVAFSAGPEAELAVRVFDNTTPDHYVEFTD